MFLLLFSTFLDYFTGIKIYEAANKQHKKTWLWLSIIVNLGFLCVFKYYNFFATSFASALSLLGIKANMVSLQLILPVGISFYTFHGLSYVLDLYKSRTTPERNFINYAVFVGFFPLLVAGPIERATHLLPQIVKKRSFDYAAAADGMRQILWGLFKKIVIADNCAAYANAIFNHSTHYSGSTLCLGALFFSIQIYCDFSGYSDIAIGTARLFGIDLLRNFAFPYFSRNVAEFWRRWHISLSSWFRDYLYIPLGGSRGGTWLRIRNVFIIFLLSGFWHGANWTFIVWGFLNALYILPSVIFNSSPKTADIVAKGRYLPTIREFCSMLFTFSLIVFAWIFFRAANVSQAVQYVYGIFSQSLFTVPHGAGITKPILVLIILFFAVEWWGREQEFAIAQLVKIRQRRYRWSVYSIILLLIFYFGAFFKNSTFIYFQF